MQRYANLSGNSGVTHYRIGPDFIDVRFCNGDFYRYSYRTPGLRPVEEMKRLALEGKGLSAFVSRHVRAYERKLGLAAGE